MTARSAFEAIFAAHYDAVTRFAMRRVPQEAVHDVVSETFLTAWRRFDDLRGEPLPWLLGIARRVSANQLRGGERRAALVERLGAQVAGSGAGPDEVDGELLHALARLSERDREALILVAWDGLTNRQAAEVVGCSATAFGVRLHRARGRLKRELERRGQGSVDLSNEASVLR
ncbi:MAG TPA: RNA polymerase sigma factor [Thermoleophilaceae bacterium]|nr:RNA polymerase sigma factor [Thermoleophilaceae bacterium]